MKEGGGARKEERRVIKVAFEGVLPLVVVQIIQGRGAAVIKARKLSSAMSAAKAICDHLRDWHFGTPQVGFKLCDGTFQ